MTRANSDRRRGGRSPRRPELALLTGTRGVYVVGLLAAVTAASLVLLAEAIARGIASLAAGDAGWRDALVWGVAAALLRAGAAWATQVVAARAAIGTKERVRARLAETLLGGNPRAGSATTLATRELDALDDFFAKVLPAIAAVAVIPLLIGVRILIADWVSALVIVLTVPLIPVFMILVGQYTKERTDAATTALARLSDHIVELARGLPVLVGLGRVDEQAAALDRISEDYRRTTLVTLRTAFLSALVLEVIATISVAVVAVFIGLRLLDGQLGLATGLLVLILAPECYQPFRELGTAFHSSRAGMAALANAEAVIAAPPRTDPRTPERPAAPGTLVAVEHLTITHEGRAPAVRDLSFALPAQGVTALVGASGAGKSTVLRALAGRADADVAGTIAGIDPTLVAWAPQHPHTVARSVRDELLLYSDNDFAVEWMLSRLGLLSLADADPARLSPGELRRLAVARAMLRVDDGATVVLLDEPTAHLDDRSAAAVVSLVRWAGERASVLVASHDASVTALAGRFVELGGGEGARGRRRSSPDLEVEPVESVTARDARLTRGDVRTMLATFVRPAIGRYLAAIALGTLAAAFAIALTGVSAWLIVRASELPAIMYLLVAIVGVRFFGLGRAALRYCERLVTHDAVFASTTALRHRLWASLAARGASSRVLQRGGTALDYLVGAADDVRDLVPRILVPTAVGGTVSALALLTTWLILPAATGVMALVVLGGAIVAPAVAVIADRAAEVDRLQQRSGMVRWFAAALDAADDVRGNAADGRVREALADLDEHAGKASRRIARSRGLGAAIVIATACSGAMGMLAVAAQAELAVALAAVLVLLPIALIDPLLGLLGGIAHAPALASALARVGELDTAPASRGERPGPGAGVDTLELDGVAAAWTDGEPVFRDLSARVERGDWLVVEGPSGSGKSTLLSVLLGSLAPAEGRVLVNGRDLAELDARGTVAWCPQESHLFDSTVRANLLLGRPGHDRPTDEELVAALRDAGLAAVLARLPEGLDTRIGSQGSRLSGGERQRLAIARTLLSRAGIVLLDEPTAHLDEATAAELMADLRRVFADRIVVLVTHHDDDRLPTDARLVLAAAVG